VHYADKLSEQDLAFDPQIIVSGINELQDMQKHLLTPEKLHG
jgi:hypothetical protein